MYNYAPAYSVNRQRTIPTRESLVTGPIREPLDLEQVKKHIRFSATSEDTLIDGWISAARQFVEERTHRQILTATWDYLLDAFPSHGIELPRSPLQSIERIQYVDGAGIVQTWDPAEYHVTAPSGPQPMRGWVEPAYGFSWPSQRLESGAVRVRYKAGWGDAPGDVPELLRSGLYLVVAAFHCNREGLDDIQVSTLLRMFRSDPSKLPEWC